MRDKPTSEAVGGQPLSQIAREAQDTLDEIRAVTGSPQSWDPDGTRVPHGPIRGPGPWGRDPTPPGQWPWRGQPVGRSVALRRIRARRAVEREAATCLIHCRAGSADLASATHQRLLTAAIEFWDALDVPSDLTWADGAAAPMGDL